MTRVIVIETVIVRGFASVHIFFDLWGTSDWFNDKYRGNENRFKTFSSITISRPIQWII